MPRMSVEEGSEAVEDDAAEAGPDEMYCSECGSVIREKAEVCPECGVRVQPAQASTEELTDQQQTYMKVALATGALFCAISLVLLPIVFAPLALLLGVVVALKYDTKNGIILMVAAVICGFIGAAVGVLVTLLF